VSDAADSVVGAAGVLEVGGCEMRSWAAGVLIGLLALAASREARADESYNAPLVGAVASFGARSGWGGGDAAIAGGGLFFGGRWSSWRLGAIADANWWRADPGVAVDFGGFVSDDLVSLWLDPAISAAWFVRLEPTFRFVSSSSRWAFMPAGGTGVRALGWELGLIGRPEIGLESLPSGASRHGIDVEFRVGVDLVEFWRFGQHLSDANKPMAP
jgi:hypothetical protein